MKKSAKHDPLVERTNLDFSKGIRGKYADAKKQYSQAVVLDPDLREAFPDSSAVNRALRALLAIDQQTKSVRIRTTQVKKVRAVV